VAFLHKSGTFACYRRQTAERRRLPKRSITCVRQEKNRLFRPTIQVCDSHKLLLFSRVVGCSWQQQTVQYTTVQYSTVQYSRVQYSTVHYHTVQYSTVQYSTVQYSTVQCNTEQNRTIQYSTVKYSTVECSRV